MIGALAGLEGGALFAALCAAMMGCVKVPLLAGGAADWHALALAVGITASTLIALYYADAYDLDVVPGPGRLAARLPRCLAFAAAPLIAVWVWCPSAVLAAAVAVGGVLALLPLLRAPFYRLVHRGVFAERVLIIGTGVLARQAMEAVETAGLGRCAIVGVVDDELDAEESFVPPDERLGPLGGLERIIAATRPDRIVVALEDRRRRLPVRPLLDARFAGAIIEDAATFYERLTGKIAIEALTPSSLIFSQDFRPPRLAVFVGRALSLAIAVVGLVALLPAFALIALCIRRDSPGPVFFVQARVGRGGRHFPLVKFRTMQTTEAPPSEWALDNAHRVTRVGRWLRRFRLDELPQLLNVLHGDMDLVGPRPHPASNFSLFVTVLRNSPECGEQIPYYSLRSMVRPGITGWAQVRYRYANNLEEEIEKMRYDLYYVKHRSLWLDLRIMADTVKTVLAGREALDESPRPSAIPPRPQPRWQLAARSR